MALRTPLCDLFGIDVPILNVGFGQSATPELAAAVSNAGGLGVLGFTGGGMPPEEIRRRIEHTRARTSRPFGGNIIISDLEGTDEAARAATRGKIAAALDARIPVLVLFWGDPAPFVDPAHAAGTKLVVQVGSAEEAGAAARAGVDAIIAQGVEAGGHVRAVDSIWDVLPRAVEAARGVPVLAAGGITNGTSIARALRMGAQGVSLGTRFVASTEAWVHERHKEKLVEATASDTVFGLIFTVGWPDAPHRALRNRTVREWEAAGSPPEGSRPGEGELIGTRHESWGDFPMRRYQVGMVTPTFEGDVELAVIWAGQSVDAVRSVRPAAEIVASLVADAEKALATGG
jgi:NAD(P)H-dependent flavin oxidoreductase YrpB (nitropropane dioxygenase family)